MRDTRAMPTVITSLLNSEKAVMAIVLLIAATVLTALGHMTITEWKEFATYVFGIYVGGKAIQGAADAMAKRPAAPAQTNVAIASEGAKTAGPTLVPPPV